MNADGSPDTAPRLGPFGSLDEACSTCGHRPIARVVRGMPPGPPTAEEDDYLVLGGCVVSGDDPTHECKRCGAVVWADRWPGS